MKALKKFPSLLLTAAVLLAIVLFLVFPARYSESVKEGIMLWAVSVLPATLPFLFLTAIFTKRKLFSRVTRLLTPLSGKAFHISGAGACAAFLSVISGYPVGARTVLDLYAAGHLSDEEKLRVAAIATTTGPGFLVGAVGYGMFHSPVLGWLLFAAHLIGIYPVCFLLRFTAKQKTFPLPPLKEEKISLAEILSSSVLSVLCVGGAIALFYAFGAMIADMGALFSLPHAFEVILRGLLEMTSGCSLLKDSPTPFSLALCAFFVTFGGLCVLVQQLAFLTQTGISAPKFILIKFCQGVLAALACAGLALLFGI